MDRARDDGNEDSPEEGEGPVNERTYAPPRVARSGDFSEDPAFDPDQLFEVISREENAERVTAAMHQFLTLGDFDRFEQAVAVFVRSARARGDPVEQVLAVLISLAQAREGVAYPHDFTLTELRWVVLRGVLLAFYGDTSLTRTPGVDRRRGRERRRINPPDDPSGEAF